MHMTPQEVDQMVYGPMWDEIIQQRRAADVCSCDPHPSESERRHANGHPPYAKPAHPAAFRSMGYPRHSVFQGFGETKGIFPILATLAILAALGAALS
jgi:hypothetical protein